MEIQGVTPLARELLASTEKVGALIDELQELLTIKVAGTKNTIKIAKIKSKDMKDLIEV